ncbi:MAG: twin-arginine translocase subunit TatC, partial [Bacteroidota bacterium]
MQELQIEEEKKTVKEEMSFLDHLEELRWIIVKIIIGLIISVSICGYFSDWIVNQVILRPSLVVVPPLELINTIPYGQITFFMAVILVAGIILGSPWTLYQLWKFIQPA